MWQSLEGIRPAALIPINPEPKAIRANPRLWASEAKDRLQSLNDYQTNLTAELEIRHPHERLDHLTTRRWERLAEIQEMQIERLQERQ